MNTLHTVAQALVDKSKGILAADESASTIKKRFDTISFESTEENRRNYRELLFTTPQMEQWVSGVILYDETFYQSTVAGVRFVDLLRAKGVYPGIKVDEGLEAFGNAGEKVTKGLDTLAVRLAKYAQDGAAFSKWRAVITIGAGVPTDEIIARNAEDLARYALLSQQAGIVPIVEPEVLMDGSHSIEECERVTAMTLAAVFDALTRASVDMKGMLLKPNMVVPGKAADDQSTDEIIARRTVDVLRATVPAEVPGIVFLSGGQSPQQATSRLNMMNRLFAGALPWKLSFSYGRALQEPVLHSWQGKKEHSVVAQEAFARRCELNSMACAGTYDASMESPV
jgi:fructose-bisphosphate aldolase, class I